MAKEYDPQLLEEKAKEVTMTIFDPEIPVNIYELGLIYEIKAFPVNNIYVRMTLTSPACPVAGTLPGEVEQKIRDLEEVQDVKLDLVFDPPWDMEMMSEEAKLELGLI